MTDDTRLQQLAGAMLEGSSLDWESAESEASNESMRNVVRELQVIAGIAELHGRMPLSFDRQLAASVNARSPEGSRTEPGADRSETWGALRLLEKVGEGAYGQVYRARDVRLEREVALKLLHYRDSACVDLASTVIEEGRMLAQVRHPNVVTVYGADRSDGRVGLWMEFIHGMTLEQALREQGPLPAEEATRIGVDLCRAVAAVHRAGLVHRDIKAQNVMREAGGRIVLMDFGTGLDRSRTELVDAAGRDGAHALAGTPLYIAPEVLEGRESSVQSDVYAIGVLLYRLVTNSYPVQGRTMEEIREKQARGEHVSLRDARPDLADSFVKIVERSLSQRPEERYENAGAIEAALVSTIGVAPPLPVAVANGSFHESPVRTPGRQEHWWHKAAIAAALLVLIGLGWMWIASLGSGTPVIAVLPFENLGTDPDSAYLADGLTDELIDHLSQIDGLSVRSRTSSFAFRNRSQSLADVGSQLGADIVLEGSVWQSGDRLRVTARLARVAGDATLWASKFDREAKDVFAIQDEISLAIINELRVTLGRGQRRYQTDPHVYYQFLKARVLHAKRNSVNSVQAAELFEQVVAQDPAYAPAWAGLARAMASAPMTGNELPTPDPKMEAAALKAIQLDPLLAEAHAAMGNLHIGNRDWLNAEVSFVKALELNPSLTTTHTDLVLWVLLPQGRFDDALRHLDTARQADPLSLDVRRVQALVEVETERYDDAIESCRWVLARDPQFPYANLWLARALMLSGRAQDAIPVLENEVPPIRSGYLGYLYAVTGRRAEAEEVAAQFPEAPVRQMLIYGGLGDKERAFEALEKAAGLNWWMAATWSIRPEMALLRGDPRLTAIREKLGLPGS